MAAPNRSRILFFFLSAALVLPVVTGALAGAALAEKDDDPTGDSLYKYLSVFTEVLSLVRRAYVDEVDLDALIAGAVDGAADALDPFSTYVPAAEVDSFLRNRDAGISRSGLLLLKDRGIAYVVSVIAGSPAAEAGVEAGDVVAKLDGRSTRLMPLWEVQRILAAAAGTEVTLEVLREGEPAELKLTLGRLTPPAPALEEVRGVPLLRIPVFTPAAAAAVEEILGGLTARGVERLLVDLRGVAVGDPEVAYEVAGFFVEGHLGMVRDREATLERFAGEAPPAWRGDLVVLVDRSTLGAAEILAAILRDGADARLVGQETFGHAGRQDRAELSNGGRLFYTGAFYTGPDGEPLDESLEPDVAVEEVVRSFAEQDLPVDELILEKGIELLANPPLRDVA